MFEMSLSETPEFLAYLWVKKRYELLTSILILFVLPTFPYIILSVEMLNRPFKDQLNYFGDGSMISLCIGIICTYFGKTHDFKTVDEKNKHKLYNVIAVLIYFALIYLFMECQKTSPRTQLFIWVIAGVSLVVLLFTSIFSLMLSFDDYPDFQKYKEQSRLKDTEQKIVGESNSKSKIKV